MSTVVTEHIHRGYLLVQTKIHKNTQLWSKTKTKAKPNTHNSYNLEVLTAKKYVTEVKMSQVTIIHVLAYLWQRTWKMDSTLILFVNLHWSKQGWKQTVFCTWQTILTRLCWAWPGLDHPWHKTQTSQDNTKSSLPWIVELVLASSPPCQKPDKAQGHLDLDCFHFTITRTSGQPIPAH